MAEGDATPTGRSFAAAAADNLLPFRENGRFGKNLLWLSAFAAIGAGAAFTGATLPFQTAVSATVAAPGATATTVATAAPTTGFLSTTGSVAAEFGAHAVNGIAYLGGTSIDIVQHGNWGAFGHHVGEAAGALSPS